MDEMSIGEFAKRSRLSPKALRLYDELGLLAPVRVDDGSGYRFYAVAQLDPARLVAALRRLQMPLAEIKTILALEPAAAGERIAEYWAAVEVEHAARRRLAGYVVDRISGKRTVMYKVKTRDIPARSVLCLKRNVAGHEQAWALGKEFVALLKRRRLPRVEGTAGGVYCIYWSGSARTATARSSGAARSRRPGRRVRRRASGAQPPDRAGAPRGVRQPRTGHPISPARWQLASESLHAWAEEHAVRPSELA